MEQNMLTHNNSGLWIISPGHFAKFDLNGVIPGAKQITATEYKISSVGRYMIGPIPFEISKQLVGCEVRWRPSTLARWKQVFRKLRGQQLVSDRVPLKLFLEFNDLKKKSDDEGLTNHVNAIYDHLRPYDSFYQSLTDIDLKEIEEIVGICEDNMAVQSYLTLNGNLADQLSFVKKLAGKAVNVRLERAHIANGLFEMKGFDFKTYSPDDAFRLIQFNIDNQIRALVLKPDNTLDFWVEDVKLIHYLKLFGHSIQQNDKMRESLRNCIQGNAVPLRLLVDHSLEIDYRHGPLPIIFQNAAQDGHLNDQSSKLLKQTLNLYQVGVSLNTLSNKDTRIEELCTDISVLHNLRALEPIKNKLPSIVDELSKKAANCDAGQFYLLDTIRGVRNES